MAFRRQDRHRLLFNAQTSDTAGQEIDVLVSCGHMMLRDELILNSINHQCLICQKTFFMPGALEAHLRQHDYKQYNTMWCHRRLLLTCAPCPCCGSDSHSESHNCPALLNLAVLLANGRHPRQGDFHLGISFDPRATSELRNQAGGRGQAEQEAQAQRQGLLHHWFDRRPNVEPDENDGTHHSQARGLHPCAASGISVCTVSSTRGREPASSTTGLSSNLAEGGSQSVPATLDGSVCHENGKGPSGQTEGGPGQCRRGPGLHSLQPHRPEQDDAVSEVGRWPKADGAQQGKTTADWRGEPDSGHHCPSPSVGAGDHAQIPCSLQASIGGQQWENDPILMDGGSQNTGRTVESLANRVISQHLATCAADAAPSNPAAVHIGQAAGKDDVDELPKHMVRILENTTSTMCYVNAALQALAWCTLLCQGLHPRNWRFGYELMRGICQWNPIPLNLRVFQPFLWLLFGAFSEQDLSTQQDILEFTAFILDRLAPDFLSCQWCTRFQFVTKESHPILDSEKGDRYAPILIRFIDFAAEQCSLDELLFNWHDPSGLCRACDQARACIALMFDRHIDGQNRKCLQRITLHSNIISIPCFLDVTGEMHFVPYHLVAVTFHLGHSPNSGHHRVALRYRGGWLVYDDNRLPDPIAALTDEILCNATMFWLIQINDTAARTIGHPGSVTPCTGGATSAATDRHPTQLSQRPAASVDHLSLPMRLRYTMRPQVQCRPIRPLSLRRLMRLNPCQRDPEQIPRSKSLTWLHLLVGSFTGWSLMQLYIACCCSFVSSMSSTPLGHLSLMFTCHFGFVSH